MPTSDSWTTRSPRSPPTSPRSPLRSRCFARTGRCSTSSGRTRSGPPTCRSPRGRSPSCGARSSALRSAVARGRRRAGQARRAGRARRTADRGRRSWSQPRPPPRWGAPTQHAVTARRRCEAAAAALDASRYGAGRAVRPRTAGPRRARAVGGPGAALALALDCGALAGRCRPAGRHRRGPRLAPGPRRDRRRVGGGVRGRARRRARRRGRRRPDRRPPGAQHLQRRRRVGRRAGPRDRAGHRPSARPDPGTCPDRRRPSGRSCRPPVPRCQTSSTVSSCRAVVVEGRWHDAVAAHASLPGSVCVTRPATASQARAGASAPAAPVRPVPALAEPRRRRPNRRRSSWADAGLRWTAPSRRERGPPGGRHAADGLRRRSPSWPPPRPLPPARPPCPVSSAPASSSSAARSSSSTAPAGAISTASPSSWRRPARPRGGEERTGPDAASEMAAAQHDLDARARHRRRPGAELDVKRAGLEERRQILPTPRRGRGRLDATAAMPNARRRRRARLRAAPAACSTASWTWWSGARRRSRRSSSRLAGAAPPAQGDAAAAVGRPPRGAASRAADEPERVLDQQRLACRRPRSRTPSSRMRLEAPTERSATTSTPSPTSRPPWPPSAHPLPEGDDRPRPGPASSSASCG